MNKAIRFGLRLWISALLFAGALPAIAVETAPRISDREIIESLIELKTGQKALEAGQKALEAGQKALEARIDQRFTAFQNQIDQRFEAFQNQVDQRFEVSQQQIDQRFEAVDQRFEAVDQQLDKIWALMLVMIAGIFGLIGYIVWDRKTALRPVEQRLIALESEFHRDLEIQHEEGSRLTRLVKVLREMAKTDEKLANVLRSFSLL